MTCRTCAISAQTRICFRLLPWRVSLDAYVPEELPLALAHIHGLHHGTSSSTVFDHAQRCSLSPCSSAIVMRSEFDHRDAVCHVGVSDNIDYGDPKYHHVEYSLNNYGLCTYPSQDLTPQIDSFFEHAIQAHLPYGFRTTHFEMRFLSDMAFQLSSYPHEVMHLPLHDRLIGMRPRTFSVAKHLLDNPDPTGLLNDIMPKIWSLEDSLCRERLAKLPKHAQTLNIDRPMSPSLALDLVKSLGSDLPYRLDTMFVGRSITVEHDDAADSPYGNVFCFPGLTVLQSDNIPDDVAYVTSMRGGPLFISGPTAVHCGDDELTVARYCATAYSGSASSLPGFMVRAK